MIETLPDGRRRYTYASGAVRYYTPKRTKGPKTEGRNGVYVGHHWKEFTPVLPEEERTMPQTVPHEVIQEHVFGCECDPCADYGMRGSRLKRRYRGLRPNPRHQRTMPVSSSVSSA